MAYPIGLPMGLDPRIDSLLPGVSAQAARKRQETRTAQLATPAAAQPSVRPAQPPPSAQAVKVPRRPPERPAPLAREREPIGAAVEGREHGIPAVACREREQERGGEQGEEGTSLGSVAAVDSEEQEELHSALIAALLGHAHESGMFEVLLPGGEALGVAVDVRPGAIDYLLTPASERTATQLRGRQMELAGQLGQRIGRSVRVTVL